MPPANHARPPLPRLGGRFLPDPPDEEGAGFPLRLHLVLGCGIWWKTKRGGPMHHATDRQWEKLTVPPERVLDRIETGMSIFLSTGVAEPRTLVKLLMETEAANLEDLAGTAARQGKETASQKRSPSKTWSGSKPGPCRRLGRRLLCLLAAWFPGGAATSAAGHGERSEGR